MLLFTIILCFLFNLLCNLCIFSVNLVIVVPSILVLKMKKWSSQWTQFVLLRKEAWKKKFRTSTGFEPVTSRLPLRCSTNWAMKPLTLGAGSRFFTHLHKLRSLRRSFLHFHFIFAVHISSIRVARNFCGSLFLRIGDFLCLRELIFAIFRNYPAPSIDDIFVFIEYVQ